MSRVSRRGQPKRWRLTVPEDSDLTQTLPELEALRHVIEQNDWHNDDAFQQSLHLFRWVKRLPGSLLKIISLPEATLQALLNSLEAPANGYYTTRELLGFTAVVHDVGKAKTFERLPDGAARCPGHEQVGARLAPAICARFDFSPAETDFITTLVGAHGEPYNLFKKIATLSAPQQQGEWHRFEAKHADHLIPLLLLACGDLVTSHLRTIRPQKYEAILSFYRHWLRSIWPAQEQKETDAFQMSRIHDSSEV